MTPPKPEHRKTYKTPLLVGGVFGIGLIALAAFHYRIVRVPFDRLPKGAAAAITVFEIKPEHQKAFVTLAEAAGIEQASGDGPMTYVATPDDSEDGLSWSIFNSDGSSGRFRLVANDLSGIGLVRGLGEATLPLKLRLYEDQVAFVVGWHERGFMNERVSPFIYSRLADISTETASVYAGWNASAQIGLIPNGGPFSDILLAINHPAELILGKQNTGPMQDFLMRAPSFDKEGGSKSLELAIKQTLGQLDPHQDAILLEDRSIMTELRSSSASVSFEERTISTGIVRTYTSMYNKATITTYVGQDGWLWISNSADTIRAFVIGQTSVEKSNDDSCVHSLSTLNVAVYPQNMASYTHPLDKVESLLSLFKRVGYSIHNRDAGLFTVCGYLY